MAMPSKSKVPNISLSKTQTSLLMLTGPLTSHRVSDCGHKAHKQLKASPTKELSLLQAPPPQQLHSPARPSHIHGEVTAATKAAAQKIQVANRLIT
jgi:hypothetical protein